MANQEKLVKLFNSVKYAIAQPFEKGKTVFRKDLPFSVFYTSLSSLFIILFSFYDRFTFLDKNIVTFDNPIFSMIGVYFVVFIVTMIVVLFTLRPKIINKCLFVLVPIAIASFIVSYILTSLDSPAHIHFQTITILVLAITNGFIAISIFEMVVYILGGYERLLCTTIVLVSLMAIVFINVILESISVMFTEVALPFSVLFLMYFSMFIMDKSAFSDVDTNNEKTPVSVSILSIGIVFVTFFTSISLIVLRSHANIDINILRPTNVGFYAGMISAVILSFIIFLRFRYSIIINLILWWIAAIFTYQVLSIYIINTNFEGLYPLIEFLMGVEFGLSIIATTSFMSRILEERATIKSLRLHILIIIIYIASLTNIGTALFDITILDFIPLLQSFLFVIGVVSIGVSLIAWIRSRNANSAEEAESASTEESASADSSTDQVASDETPVQEANEKLEFTPPLVEPLAYVPESNGINPYEVLTVKEILVFDQLIIGYTLRQISGILRMKYDTVNYHYKNIYRKLNINSKIELLIQYSKYVKK